MIPELGLFALILSLACALALSIMPMVGSYTRDASWMAVARPAALLHLLFLTIAYFALTISFINSDFSVSYVAQTSNRQLPLMYRISGVWGGHEGSILFWAFILAVWTGAVAQFSRHMPLQLVSRVLSVLGMISVGFLLFTLLTSNPFLRQFPVPLDGASLNPLLQDPGMAFHPPMLYMGYVGFAVAFAFAIAALLGGQLDSATLRWMRPWTNLAWMFLTFGIALGSYWAYYELGWGGWWFWDPVENASFMPWLVGTALIHSLAASEKRGVFKAWTVLLAVMAFSLSLLGTFLVRSGVLTSVHSFSNDPARGAFILLFLVVVVGGSLALYALRAHRLKSTTGFELLSRESGILLNNVMMVVACATVLGGTLFPLFYDAMGFGTMSAGTPYFNIVFIPLMVPVMLCVGIGAMLNWKRDNLRDKKVWYIALAALSIVLGIIAALQLTPFKISAVISLAVAFWIISSSLHGLYHRVRNKRAKLASVLHTPAAFWGMFTAHMGLAVFALGVAMTSIYTAEEAVRMAPGETYNVSGYDFTFNGVREVVGPNYRAAAGDFSIAYGDDTVGDLTAEKRIYNVRRDVMTEAGIDASMTRDLFVALGEPLNDGAWSVRLQVKPFIRWIWYGCLLMGIGGLLAACDKRYRTAKVEAKGAVGQSPANSSDTSSSSTPGASGAPIHS